MSINRVLSFKVYEFDGDTYSELGTVLHEDTLFKIAKRLSKAELATLYIETLKGGEPIHQGKKGELCISPLSTWS